MLGTYAKGPRGEGRADQNDGALGGGTLAGGEDQGGRGAHRPSRPDRQGARGLPARDGKRRSLAMKRKTKKLPPGLYRRTKKHADGTVVELPTIHCFWYVPGQ